MCKPVGKRFLIGLMVLCVTAGGAMLTATRTAGSAPPARKLQSPCTADPGGPYTGTVGQSIQFDSSSSVIDWDGCCVNYFWTFGDGTSSHFPNPTHAYSAAGTYTVTLTLTHTIFSGMCRSSTTATISN